MKAETVPVEIVVPPKPDVRITLTHKEATLLRAWLFKVRGVQDRQVGPSLNGAAEDLRGALTAVGYYGPECMTAVQSGDL
jgi:hypothetical protein